MNLLELIKELLNTRYSYLIPITVISGIYVYMGGSISNIASISPQTFFNVGLVGVLLYNNRYIDDRLDKLLKIEEKKSEQILGQNSKFLRELMLSKTHDLNYYYLKIATKAYNKLKPFGATFNHSRAEVDASLNELKSAMDAFKMSFIRDIKEAVRPKFIEQSIVDSIEEKIDKSIDQTVDLFQLVDTNNKLEQILEIGNILDSEVSSIIIDSISTWENSPIVVAGSKPNTSD